VVARRDDVGAHTRRATIRRRAGHASRVRDGAPTRSPDRRLFTIFSRFLAFMFSTRRFATGSRRVAQCAPFLFLFCLGRSSIMCSPFLFDRCVCRFILYGLRAHALRLSGCWVSVRRSMSSYFDRVAILTDCFFFKQMWDKSHFLLSFIHFYPCVCNITYARASLNGSPLFPCNCSVG